MATKRYKVFLEISEQEIFYHWVYDPPVPNTRGGLGTVLPGGTMRGVPYDKLRALGGGTHKIQFDETHADDTGKRSTAPSEDDLLFLRLRFELFADRVKSCMPGQPFAAILLAMTPGNADRIVPLLGKPHVAKLKAYAKTVGATKAARQKESHPLFPGATAQLP